MGLTKKGDGTSPSKDNTTKAKPVVKEAETEAVPQGEAEARSMVASSSALDLNMTSFIDSGEDTGNSGMELDRTSFPVVVLDGAEFVDSVDKQPFNLEGNDLSKGFICQIIAYKGRVSYTVTEEGAKDEDSAYYVMVDETTTHTGEKIADIIAVAEADNADCRRKEYTEYVVVMFDVKDTKAENPLGMASLSVPPASKGKVAGAIVMYQVVKKQKIDHPSKAIMAVSVGKKISKDRISYYPWAFEVIGKFEE